MAIRILYIDLFCGAGGTSTGVERARLRGRKCAKVIACVNHDANAIASHAANHPHALHFTEDIRTLPLGPLKARIERERRRYPKAKVVLWASLECTNHSRAKGGTSRDADSRTLAEHLYRYIEILQPDYIHIENVVEFMEWGPLIVKEVSDPKTGVEYCPLNIKRDKKRQVLSIGPVWIPEPDKKGIYYRRWVQQVREYGYNFEHRVLNSADFGAYTSRVRYFGQFARPELPIAWPQQTHAKNPVADLFSEGLKPWRAVREVLNFEDRGESIFTRSKSLVDATLDRIHAGLVKFVAGGEDAFLVKWNSRNQNTGKYIAPSLDAPCPTVATQNRLGVARVDFLSKQFSGQPQGKNIPVTGPAGTITTVDHHAFVSAYYGNGFNSSIERPAPTLTTKDRFQLVQPFIANYYSGGGQLSSVDEPSGTIMTTPQTTPRKRPLSDEPTIPVRRRFRGCPVFYSDCPNGQTPTVPGIGRAGHPGLAHQPRRQSGNGTGQGVLHPLRNCGRNNANAPDSRNEAHPRLRRRLRAGRDLGGAKEIPRERGSNPGSDRMERSRGRSTRKNRNQPQGSITPEKYARGQNPQN